MQMNLNEPMPQSIDRPSWNPHPKSKIQGYKPNYGQVKSRRRRNQYGPRRLRARYLPDANAYQSKQMAEGTLRQKRLNWQAFGREMEKELRTAGYSEGTQATYKHIWENYARFAREDTYGQDFERVEQSHFVIPNRVEAYLVHLSNRNVSPYWLSMNLNVLRTAFDKLGGYRVTENLSGPRMPKTLPEILTRSEVKGLFESFGTMRDHILFGLVYCCGLKVGEVCRLTWGDINIETANVTVTYARGSKKRELPLATEMLPVLEEGKASGRTHGYLFPGRNSGSHLTARAIQLSLQKAAKLAGLGKPVTCMMLRHAYAVHQLEAGATIRAVQENLGHLEVASTLRYEGLMEDMGVISPLDNLGVPSPLQAAAQQFSKRAKLPFTAARNPKAYNFALKARSADNHLGVYSGSTPLKVSDIQAVLSI